MNNRKKKELDERQIKLRDKYGKHGFHIFLAEILLLVVVTHFIINAGRLHEGIMEGRIIPILLLMIVIPYGYVTVMTLIKECYLPSDKQMYPAMAIFYTIFAITNSEWRVFSVCFAILMWIVTGICYYNLKKEIKLEK